MKVLVTGISGLIGSAMARELRVQGHEVIGVSRSPSPKSVGWQQVNPTLMNDVDAVINLAGETVAGRWTDAKKRRLLDSRLETTKLVAAAVWDSDSPPSVLIQASASGYYGQRGDEVLDESSSNGSGFLADLCQQWEAAAAPAETAKTRLVFARFSVVLASEGGALGRLRKVTRLGIGGPLGKGRQWWSWISLQDTVRALCHILEGEISGPVNIACDQPQRQRAFAKTLGSVLRRPSFTPVPAIAIRAVLGQMGESLLLDSTRLRPSALIANGFEFEDGELEGALRRIFNT
ncbi:MAG: TIGR01777 family oxidoreductase [Acidimicrobiales bacterium]|nr:TIGR01777 family oxidoreductase [Acidimicrobiales bacterium]